MARQFDDWLGGFMEWTENSESPSLYREWVGINVIAAAMQRKCFLRWGSLEFYPNMYILLIGPSGARKGTAMKPGEDLLTKLGIKMSAQSTTREALIKKLKESTYNHIDPSTQAMEFHSSLTIFSEEFTVFLGYHNLALIADLCDWFDCKKKWSYETKNMGKDEITGIWVNMLGATTPDSLRSALPGDAIGGGLTSRIIFVYEEGKEKIVLFPQMDEKLGTKLEHDLEKINLMRGNFDVTKEFFARWAEWYTLSSQKPAFQDEKFAGYNERRPMHLMKLSMIMSASESDSKLVRVSHFERALDLLERTEVKMQYTFAGYGKSDIADLMRKIIIFMATKKVVSLAQLMQHFYEDADLWRMERVITALRSMNYIKLVEGKANVYQFIGPDQLGDKIIKVTGGTNDVLGIAQT